MRFDWISRLAVRLLGRNAGIDLLHVSGVLVEFGGAFFQACATPEGLTNLTGLVNNLLLFDELCEQDIEGTDRHGEKNEKNGTGARTAVLESYHKTGGIFSDRRVSCCCKLEEDLRALSYTNIKNEGKRFPF